MNLLPETKYIYVISDIHIHSTKRFEEYSAIFSTLISILSAHPSKSVLLITGDILNDYDVITNESVKLLFQLLNICNILPLIITQSNPLIESIVKEHYASKPIYFSIDPIYTIATHKIGIYNGDLPLPSKYSSCSYVLTNGPHQFVSPTVMSAGSLIQQDHFDPLIHGLIRIDLSKSKTTFISVPNDHAFCTMQITNNKLIPTESPLPKYLNIQFQITDSEPDAVNKIIKSVYNTHHIISHQIIHTNTPIKTNSILPTNVNDTHNQLKFINAYMKSLNHNKLTRNRILKLHLNLSKSIKSTTPDKGICKLVEIRFDNILCYGTQNVINFESYDSNSLIALMGKNYAGKSSIFDIILFGLFDRISRPNRENIMNIRAETLSCELVFRLGQNSYLITRTGKRTPQGLVRTDVTFRQINPDGTTIKNLTFKGKKRTNELICDHVGTFDSYVCTTFVLHKNNNNILADTPMEQKKGLCQILQMDRFVPFHNKIKTLIKEKESKLDKLELKKFVTDTDIAALEMHKTFHEIITSSPVRVTPLKKYAYKTAADVECLVHNTQSNNHLSALMFEMTAAESVIHSKKEIAKINSQITRAKKLLALEKKIRNKISTIATYEIYKDLTHMNGMSFRLLQSKLPILEASMKSKLKVFGDYDIQIIFSEVQEDTDLAAQYAASKLRQSTFKLYMRRNDTLTNDISSGCGLEKMLADIVFRLALDELSEGPKLSLFVIDEELSYFDIEYLPRIGRLLKMITDRYANVLIISHNEQIVKFADHRIELKRDELTNGFINNVDADLVPPPTRNERRPIRKEDIVRESHKVIVL